MKTISNIICILIGISTFFYTIYATWMAVQNPVHDSADSLVIMTAGVILTRVFRIENE